MAVARVTAATPTHSAAENASLMFYALPVPRVIFSLQSRDACRVGMAIDAKDGCNGRSLSAFIAPTSASRAPARIRLDTNRAE